MAEMDPSALETIPEIIELDARRHLMRIPPEQDVPITDRVRRLIDTEVFQRLTGISQLGFVSLVYPGSRHTRFEHSLGVYRLSLLFLKRLCHDKRFLATVRRHEAELLIVAALLHDIGHWPFCHLIEDLALPGIPHHETFAAGFLEELRPLLLRDWGVTPEDILTLLEHSEIVPRSGEDREEYQRRCRSFHILMSILSGPIDIDKMDYLQRDSCAAGVPYGRHFDQERLIGSLCLNEEGSGLAITEKGKTAAELMVFARYVMFSEVYWHHTVRATTAMFQRMFEMAFRGDEFPTLVDWALKEPLPRWLERLRRRLQQCPNQGITAAAALWDGLFGSTRTIYKRVWQFSILEEPTVYRKLAGRSREEQQKIVASVIGHLNRMGIADTPLGPNDLLLDAPPVSKEIEFAIDVFYPNDGVYRRLNGVSPVIQTLATQQFDDYVKRVRFYAPEPIAKKLKTLPFREAWL